MYDDKLTVIFYELVEIFVFHLSSLKRVIKYV